MCLWSEQDQSDSCVTCAMPRAIKSLLLATLVALGLQGMAKDTLHLADGLDIVQLSKNSYLHISYIPFQDHMFPCNGVVYVNDGEAVVIDAPVSNEMSLVLIHWIQETLEARVVSVVVNHFHEDCLGGLSGFYTTGCSSVSHKRTCKLAKSRGFGCTMRYFTDTFSIKVGTERVMNFYPGEAHTVDNIVTWIPSERLLFGGCMVKELNAGYGNLRDANTEAWPETIQRVKERYPKAKTVVPGHGAPGKTKLLDYTIELFSNYEPEE